MRSQTTGTSQLSREEVLRILREALPELRRRFHVSSIALFGSQARGDQTNHSDIDILVDLGQPLGWEMVDLHDYLTSLLDRPVDLLTRNAVMQKPLLWQSIQEDLIRVEA